MPLEEIRPGLSRWTALHPDWTPEEGGPNGWDPEVASYLYESADGAVLFDPLVDADDVWRALDERVDGAQPPHVLLTLFWHVRSTPAVAARYPGTRVWVHDRAPWIDETRKRVAVTDAFTLDDSLPAGIQAREPREVVYWIPEHRALVAGDVLLPDRRGGIRLCPWLGERMTAEQLRQNVRALLDLPIELVLLTHGEAITNGGDALERALHAPSAA
jgi:glyoxylase-like metal-dependent hydrolase (beta-lactamase superfamily II)